MDRRGLLVGLGGLVVARAVPAAVITNSGALAARAFGFAGKIAAAATSTWNPLDKDAGITLSGGNLIATNTGGSGPDRLVRATSSHSTTGKYYFEVTDTLGTPAQTALGIGLADVGTSTGTYVGQTAGSWGFFDQGTRFHNASGTSTGVNFTTGDIIGVAVDFAAGSLWWSKNGTWISGDPALGTSPSYTGITGTLFPASSSEVVNNAVTANFGATAFNTAAPTGFVAWG